MRGNRGIRRKPMKIRQAPVTMQIYLGSGKEGLTIRENLERRIPPKRSMSWLILDLIRQADPTIFRGVEVSHGER